MSKYLNFTEAGRSASGLTGIWYIRDKCGAILGSVAWYGPWRKYVCHTADAVFDAGCLREIADFCEQLTEKHKASKSGAAT